jgi:hypothetical protein
MSLFVEKYPEFSWQESSDGIVHVTRKGATPSLAAVVLAYPGAVDSTRQQIWSNLSELPEVSAWRSANHCIRGEILDGTEFKTHNQPLSIESGSMTVAHLLDLIAIKSGTNFWAILQTPGSSGQCRLAINVW